MIPVIAISFGRIVSPVGLIAHNPEFEERSYEVVVIWVIDIVSVIPVYIATVVGVIPVMIIVDIQSAQSYQPSILAANVEPVSQGNAVNLPQ